MAFIKRGNIPLDNLDNIMNSDANSLENSKKDNVGRVYKTGLLFVHVYYYIPLDNTYVIFQMIATIIIAIVAGIAFLTTYKSSVVDPIAGLKKIYINANIIIVLILLGLTILANYFSKDKTILIKRLAIIFVISLIMILGVGIGKIYLDKTYNRAKFEQIYLQDNPDRGQKRNERIDISLSGMGVKSEKSYYVDECMKAYNVFTMRTYAIIAIDLLLIILIVFQIYKLLKMQERRSKLEKDDVVVYDEEENVKF